MYINRKTGERVDADWDVKDRKWQIAQTNGILIEVLTDKKFHEQYGEAMICPNKECSQYCECYKATPHICDYACDCSEAMSCPACIRYTGEQEEQSDGGKLNLSDISLLLSDEEIKKLIDRCVDIDNASMAYGNDRLELDDIIKMGIRAELDHLCELGIVFVKIERVCNFCDNGIADTELGELHCPMCKGTGKVDEYIPLQKYREQKI